MKIFILFFFITFSTVIAQTKSEYLFVEWSIDNLSKIGGYPVEIFGNPVVKEFTECKAVVFDGVDDGLIVHGCPINKDSSFTIEIIFKPEPSFPNNIEQRFLHIQKPNIESRRILLELRLNDKNEWFVDTHIRADSIRLTCLAKDYPHPVNRWYHIAFVYLNGIATHYVNGKKEMSGLINYIPVEGAYVSLGMRINKRSFLKGAIRTVRMTPKALDPSEFISDTELLKAKQEEKIMFSEDFENNHNNWIAEFENPTTSLLSIRNSALDINSSAGATIWFKNKLSGNIKITYDVTVIDSGGINDRVSDLNTFWMAMDPVNNTIFTRSGKFSSYDNLNLYYSGIGGNENTTSRFRKYHSNRDKPIITEYLDKEHLLKGNIQYKVKIIINESQIQYYLNDLLYFDYSDPLPYKEGYFGFRTTRSHQLIDNFKIYQIILGK